MYAYVIKYIYFTFMEDNIAINIKVETLFRGVNVFRERGAGGGK